MKTGQIKSIDTKRVLFSHVDTWQMTCKCIFSSHPRSEEPTCPVWRKFMGWPICDLSIRGLLQKTLRWVNHHFTSCIYNSSKPHVLCSWWSDTNTQLAINPAAPVGGKIWVGFELSNDYFYRSCICNAQEKTLLVSVYCRLIMWALARYKD